MSSSPKPPASFLSRHIVSIVMVPTIILLHYGWNSMQHNRSLVSENEQIDLPVVTFGKYLLKKINGTAGNPTPQAQAVNADNS